MPLRLEAARERKDDLEQVSFSADKVKHEYLPFQMAQAHLLFLNPVARTRERRCPSFL